MQTTIQPARTKRTRTFLAVVAVLEIAALLLIFFLLRHGEPACGAQALAAAGAGAGASSIRGASGGSGSSVGSGGSAASDTANGDGNAAGAAGGGGSGGTGDLEGGGGGGAATPAPQTSPSDPASVSAAPTDAPSAPPAEAGNGDAPSPAPTDSTSSEKIAHDFSLDQSGLPHYPTVTSGSINSAGDNPDFPAGSGAVYQPPDDFDTVYAWYKSHLPGNWDSQAMPVPDARVAAFSPPGDNPRGLGIVLFQKSGKPLTIVDQVNPSH